MSAITTSEMTFDFDGLIQLLASHLYSEKKVFIRELIQNGHDAIVRRAAEDASFDRDQGYVDILTDLTESPARIVFRDNGLGMTRRDLNDFLSTIGKSGTKEALEADKMLDVIGQFGIGFLSGFVVGGRVEVRTRHWQAGEEGALLWKNEGRAKYTVETCSLSHPGTEVTVYLRSVEDRGLLHDDAIKKVVRDYADMLLVAIRLNDPGHHAPAINTRVMPWERHWVSESEMRFDCLVYLEKTVPDRVLEAIPVNINDPPSDDSPGLQAEGLLYITRTRAWGWDAPRTVRVFLKRMFLCEGAKELLPEWARFVNGIINTKSLLPNAARDNFRRDSTFTRLQDRLGSIIVQHLEHLKDKEPERLSEILTFQDLSIKAACYYYEPFFNKFAHLLEWRINGKSSAARDTKRPAGRRVLSEHTGANYSWATLPEILASLPEPKGGGPKRLSCFTSSSSANQYFEMADAAGSTVLDCSFLFEADLIRTWAQVRRGEVSLVYVDRQDDPEVFGEPDQNEDRDVIQLARHMSALILPDNVGRLRVEARRFEPASLPAVLKTSEAGIGSARARDILSDPAATSDLRTLAEEVLLLSRAADMRMNINRNNPLIRTLASLILASPNDPDLNDIMLGIYNDAILYNQEFLTPRTARIFHEQFQRLIGRSLQFVKEKADLNRDRQTLDREREAQRPKQPNAQRNRNHLLGFLMTPFRDEFKATRAALRIVVEDRLGCELRIASDKTFEDFIQRNVRAHMDEADFFIADVTGANPNVMMELGAAYDGQLGKPIVLIARVQTASAGPELPADLLGHITATYVQSVEPSETVEQLEKEILKDARLGSLLTRNSRERFVSPELLRQWTDGVLKEKGIYEKLSSQIPTVADWRKATREVLEKLLTERKDRYYVDSVLSLVRDSLPAA